MIIHKINIFNNIVYKLRYLILRKFFSNKNFFFNLQDINFRYTISSGIHEPEVYYTINFYKKNYSDFFIDIGANTGITTCQVSKGFKKTYLFECNPIILNILKSNLEINLEKNSYEIFEVALGKDNKKKDLYIPKYNMGGAFILDDNLMSKKEILKKDGIKGLSSKYYSKQKITVRNTKVEITKIIKKLKKNNYRKGIIKIDTEGYEFKILKDLIDLFKKNSLEAVIIFECWAPKKLVKFFKISKNHDLKLWKITNNKTMFSFSNKIEITENLNMYGNNYILRL